MLPGWVGLAAFARARGVLPCTMRRWALALDHESGGGLLRWNKRRGKPRKYWVHPDRLRAALERDPGAREATLTRIDDRLTETEAKQDVFEKKLEAVKRLLKQLKQKQNPAPGPP